MTTYGKCATNDPGLEIIRVRSFDVATFVAFGGAHGRTLYCTESVSGSVLRAELDWPGLPLSPAQPSSHRSN